MGKSLILIIIGLMLIIPAWASAQDGFHLVPCGGTGQQPCQFKDLVVLAVRMINYLLLVAAFVAMYYVLLAAWNLITSVGNAEKIEKAKKGISNAVVGFCLVILAFVMVNLLINGIFGKEGATREWWQVRCIVNPTDVNCPYSSQ